MNTTSTHEVPEDSLRCEYFIRVFGRYVKVVSLKGAFDMPLALSKGGLGGSHYLTLCLDMNQRFIHESVCVAFREFCEEQQKNEAANPDSGSPAHPAEDSTPLHEGVHQHDLRLESFIRVYGRNLEVLSQSGDFTMPDALNGCHHQSDFSDIFRSLVMSPAHVKLMRFFHERQDAQEQERRQLTKEPFVDNQPWNFGSANLVKAIVQEQQAQEQPPERKAA